MLYNVHFHILYNNVSNQNYIYKVNSLTDTLTVFAGTGTAGYADGPALSAMFNNPRGITIDPFNNIYIADNANRRVRKIDSSGNVTSIAGSGVSGLTNSTLLSSQFTDLAGIAFSRNGNINVSDTFTVRQINISNWILTGNLFGPQGSAGAQGSQGSQGNTGAQGSTGTTGSQGLSAPIFTVFSNQVVLSISTGLYYSDDGLTWNTCIGNGVSLSGPTAGNAPRGNTSTAFNGSIWVSSTSNSTTPLAYSTDARNWYACLGFPSSASNYVFGVAWNGSIWVAIYSISNQVIMYRSSNGITWTNIGCNINGNRSPIGTNFAYQSSVAWGGLLSNRFVAVTFRSLASAILFNTATIDNCVLFTCCMASA